MSRSRARFFTLLVLAGLTSGCASYRVAELSDLTSQDRVRLELEQQELARLIQFADPATRTVTGDFVGSGPDSVSVVVNTPGSYRQVQIPRSAILGTSRREVDNRKSFIISAAIVGGVAALAIRGFEGRDSGPGGDGGGIDESRVPSFKFRIPFSLGFGR